MNISATDGWSLMPSIFLSEAFMILSGNSAVSFLCAPPPYPSLYLPQKIDNAEGLRGQTIIFLLLMDGL